MALWHSVSFPLSLSRSVSPGIDWQMQMRGAAQQNINVDFTGGRGTFDEPASCSVLNFCVFPKSPAAAAAAQGPGATPCQNKLPPASSPRNSNVRSEG